MSRYSGVDRPCHGCCRQLSDLSGYILTGIVTFRLSVDCLIGCRWQLLRYCPVQLLERFVVRIVLLPIDRRGHKSRVKIWYLCRFRRGVVLESDLVVSRLPLPWPCLLRRRETCGGSCRVNLYFKVCRRLGGDCFLIGPYHRGKKFLFLDWVADLVRVRGVYGVGRDGRI